MPDVLWKQVTVKVPTQMMDAACDFLVTLTGRGVCTREEEGAVIIDAYLGPENDEDRILLIQRFMDDLAEQGSLDEESSLRVIEVPEEDWMSVFRSQHGPVHISGRLVIRPRWCDPVGPDDLVLDPGMAFGTGSHFTTRICLELLDSLPKPPANSRMFDLGSGSGILAIAGAFLGWDDILAVDIDPVAVEVAVANVKDNNFENVVNVMEGGIERAEGVYSVITANLSGSLLVKLAGRVSPHVSVGGHLIASGIMAGEREDVVASFNRCGLKTVSIKEEDVWVGVLFNRN